MSMHLVSEPIDPATLLSLFTREGGALGESRYKRDFLAPDNSCTVHTAFTTTYLVKRGDFFCEDERVVAPFKTMIFGQVKYGPTRTGDDWLVYLEVPDWTAAGWDAQTFSTAFGFQAGVLQKVADSLASRDPPRLAVRNWLDEDTIVIRIHAETKYACLNSGHKLVSYDWVDAKMPVRIGDTVCIQATLHTALDTTPKFSARILYITATNVQKVTIRPTDD